MGTYSEPLDRELAKTLVTNKNHSVFKLPLTNFWLKYENPGVMSYGVTSKEGELKLNNKGIKFFERYFLDFP